MARCPVCSSFPVAHGLVLPFQCTLSFGLSLLAWFFPVHFTRSTSAVSTFCYWLDARLLQFSFWPGAHGLGPRSVRSGSARRSGPSSSPFRSRSPVQAQFQFSPLARCPIYSGLVFFGLLLTAWFPVSIHVHLSTLASAQSSANDSNSVSVFMCARGSSAVCVFSLPCSFLLVQFTLTR